MGNFESYWILGNHVMIVHTSAGYSLFDVFIPGPIDGPPPHIHKDFSEMFYVLDGHLEVTVDGESKVLKIGESFCVPAGAVHTFKNPMIKPARFIVGVSPGGFEKFFRDFGVAGDGEEVFEASKSNELIKKIVASAGNYGVDFVV